MKASYNNAIVELRDLFLLTPGVVYLNHGSFGACPRAVFEAYQHWQLELERQPMAFMRTLGAEVNKAREALAAFLGAQADDLVYVQNTTMGLNVVTRSLALQPGDEVLGTDHEYGAIERAWQFACQKTGARYVRQHVPLPIESADQVVDAIWSGVNERTRVLFFSHITSPTGIILPAQALVCRARQAGIITVIDGAHAPGQIPLDLEGMGVDFYSGNCHKWMMTPKGSGFLYVRHEMQAALEPLVVSWGWGNDTPHVTRFVDEQQNQGTRDMSAFLSVPAAIDFMAQYNWAQVRDNCHELIRYVRSELETCFDVPALTPDSPEWFAQMTSLPLPPCDNGELSRLLREEYQIEIPLPQWDGWSLMRLSMQGYNTQRDADVLLEGLKRLVPQVARS
jgi:isopenicillin-N epimerase